MDWRRMSKWCCLCMLQARLLKLQLPANSYEAAIRAFCEGGQAERAAKLLQQVPALGL
jgi:pentatricopeptide repeat protein